ncbi:alkaline phosphatase family protein [Rufibacter tibetensis]|nr:hypothetical protein [Rufibacter tibetensis]
MAKTLRPQGTFFSHFYNDGYTYTTSGHTAITTGVRQPIDNDGLELPLNPSIFQAWLKKSGKAATKAWIIASKDKLSVLANTTNPEWKDTYQPESNCGTDGVGNGYRADSTTIRVAKQILTKHKPNLVLINLLQPDGAGHAANWEAYLRGISTSDHYAKLLWDFIQINKNYKDKTALLITNDHGRHLDGILDGYVSHGDDCEGCRHISLLALGPDFQKGLIIETTYNLTDIATTVAQLLKFRIPTSQGKIIRELL